ncbi:hypothetical protein V8D89_003678 [Ganoderma adspersum]
MNSDTAINFNPLPNLNITPQLSGLSEHLLRLPTADRGSFSTLASISDIQECATAKANKYHQFTLAVLAIHNLVAPIHRLPTKVLDLILEQCWDDWNSLRLPHVCHLGRSILLDSAMFWADTVASCELREKRDTGHNKLPLVAALLSRSTQNFHPIGPSFYTFSPLLAQSLTSYTSSIVSLEVALDKGDLHERLWPLLLSSMPNIESLEIQPMIMKEDLSDYDKDDYPQIA